jgi:predicted signal transduction protein with EAL and GGDEF domain
VGLQVVAEGVETAEQLERIRALGCEQWQGYYCCPPQTAAELGAPGGGCGALLHGAQGGAVAGVPTPWYLTVC